MNSGVKQFIKLTQWKAFLTAASAKAVIES
jgi:hypothetical protein